ncbi:hypothetical protein HGQ17_05655 [Nesterenkonia sp. MY13]|uniref:prephenate dehydratase n=1 Tax=Nesterenkonia sedimenti TaxID=1463632 RepID=A0A7X8TIP5_9MICC|nr:prephenate dehydratase domain-containing protein [Nesterenkonia sedimenti]NLS09500.1 hypothetical protein [Nesterenkonia sedimenti]
MSQILDQAAAASEKSGSQGPRISFLGPEGTFSESVVDYIFEDRDFHRLPQNTISDCLASLASGAADHAVVPVENSTGGVVPDFWDILARGWQQRSWEITHDVVSDVSQHLFTLPELAEVGQKPVKIFSHWQALRQCRKYLDRVYPKADWVPVDSTAEAGRLVREAAGEAYAAIGHRNIGDRFGLTRLAASVEDNPFNQTRFMVVSRRSTTATGYQGAAAEARALTYHSALSPSLASVPAALAEIQQGQGWELAGCYSLPKPGYMGEYNVFMDWRTGGELPADPVDPTPDSEYVVLDTYLRVP